MQPITTSKERIYGLDLVRAIAILLILSSHSTILIFPDSELKSIKFIQFFGTVGVDVFFVLSGFLIGTILIKHIDLGYTKPQDFYRFWLRRWLRTLPNYYFILIINIVLLLCFKKKLPESVYNYFYFTQNLIEATPSFFTESWSLSIEEFAYVLGPILLLLIAIIFKRITKTSFLVVTICVIILFLITKIWLHITNLGVAENFNWSHSFRKVVITRIDSIYYGFIGAYLSFYHSKFWRKINKLTLVLGIVMFVSIHFYLFKSALNPNAYLLFYNVFYLPLLSVNILLFFPFFSTYKSKNNKVVVNISLWSYSLYLVNYSIVLLTIKQFIFVSDLSGLNKFLILLSYWVLSFMLAYLMFNYFEKPILKFRDRNINA